MHRVCLVPCAAYQGYWQLLLGRLAISIEEKHLAIVEGLPSKTLSFTLLSLASISPNDWLLAFSCCAIRLKSVVNSSCICRWCCKTYSMLLVWFSTLALDLCIILLNKSLSLVISALFESLRFTSTKKSFFFIIYNPRFCWYYSSQNLQNRHTLSE